MFSYRMELQRQVIKSFHIQPDDADTWIWMLKQFTLYPVIECVDDREDVLMG